MGRAWTTAKRTSRTTETIIVADYVAFFQQYLRFTDIPVVRFSSLCT
jgi:hypothetical protein